MSKKPKTGITGNHHLNHGVFMIPGIAMEDPYTFVALLVVDYEAPGTAVWRSGKLHTAVCCSQVAKCHHNRRPVFSISGYREFI